MHRAGTFQNLHVKSIGNVTVTVTLLQNGIATPVTCTITAATSCNDTAHSASFAAGDLVAIQTTGVASAKPLVWSIEYH
jgi:hypothetical protein